MLEFDLPKEQSSIIKVIGIGGGGSNAVNYMYEQGIRGVNFVVGNTDNQALDISPIPNKIQLGPDSTEGLGAGSNPEVGKLATEESLEEIRAILEKNTKMVFVTAGMGGGTGTGGAPVVANLARSMGILTVGICTTPFFFEGRRKMKQAEEGIAELRDSVDSLIVISNDKIREIYGNLTRSEAFARADNILAIAAKSISEIITVPGQINVDFADVEYVMKQSGVAIMGSATASGEGRAAKAIQGALASPLLNDNDIRGAQKILLNITSGTEQMLIDEITEIHEIVQAAAGNDTDVIFGTCDDESLGDSLSVTVIATGFEEQSLRGNYEQAASKRIYHTLGDGKPSAQPQPITRQVEEPKAPEAEPVNETPVEPPVEPPVTPPVVNRDLDAPVKRHILDLDAEAKQEEEAADETVDDAMGFTFSFNNPPQEEERVEEQQEWKEADDVWSKSEEPVQEKQDEPAFDPFAFGKTEEPAKEEDENYDGEPKENEFEFTIRTKDSGYTQQPTPQQPSQDDVSETMTNDRMRRLRNLSIKLNNPNNLTELENVPAFKRRNIQLNNVQHSSQPTMSRMTLEDTDEPGEIRKNNSFLHDNVD